MWIVTVYSGKNMTMYEFDKEKEARETYAKLQGYKIISQMVDEQSLSLAFN
ncbi:hypothetical protein [Bacillus thermotolerans]|uniref:Uncharacterized protein n=1 Tax=Bacillus thermotolerans TaxID=1221996 RepID=A0A0F5HLT7_BACTR|nr:hypothetical protein [Bacillus thermotolerans]KKB33298.1 hypothetical protein QY97_03564 [Bacillus thermotolerans]KKB34354.1 hypothetical protein QY95_03965 [Bacillus thermotolerans]KKB41100.1 hypothetical protein QY96_02120 [Bacillus thermotolerans]